MNTTSYVRPSASSAGYSRSKRKGSPSSSLYTGMTTEMSGFAWAFTGALH
jgi:hypothetical protein